MYSSGDILLLPSEFNPLMSLKSYLWQIFPHPSQIPLVVPYDVMASRGSYTSVIVGVLPSPFLSLVNDIGPLSTKFSYDNILDTENHFPVLIGYHRTVSSSDLWSGGKRQ